jgi:pimeloyl-ACP methyl ester carboxylesterase
MVRGLVRLEGFVTLAIHRATVAPDGFGPIRMTPEVENAWRRRRAANAAWTRGRPRFQQSFWPSQQSHDARPWVADLAAPILVVIGEHGQRLPDGPDAWRRHLGMAGVRDLTVEVVPNAGHWMMLDDPEAVGSALTRFLDRVHPGRQA